MSKRVEAEDRPDPEQDDIGQSEDLEYTLSKAISAYGESVTVLKLRKPTGADLVRIGNPVNFYPHADPIKIEHDMPKMVAMIARLSNIPSSSIEKIGPQDLIGLAWAISPFFIPAV